MNKFGQYSNADTVRFERLLPGPIERVWDYLTQPERLATWLATVSMEPFEGGKVRLEMNPEELPDIPESRAVIVGEISQYRPPRLLEYSWVDPQNPQDPPSAVRFTLATEGDSVRLTLTHRRLPHEYLDKTGAGWHSLLQILESRLTGQETPGFSELFESLVKAYEKRLKDND